MKKSDLKKHIKEEILSILKEASTALVTSKGGTKPVSFSSPTELNALKTDANVSSITTTAGQKIKEAESTEEYMISKTGSKSIPSYVLEKPDGSKQIDMFFSSPEEAKKYATKKNLKLSSKKGYNMNESKEINGIPGTVTIGGGKSGILIPTNQGDYIYYVTDDEYNAFINAGGNTQKLMATIFLKSGKAKPYKPKYNPMASLGGGKGYHIDEEGTKEHFKPVVRKDKSNPNFLYVDITYPAGSGVLSVGGSKTMSGQDREEGATKALTMGNNISKKLQSKYNIEDIDVSDGKNGKVTVFAVSDDFIKMTSPSLTEDKFDDKITNLEKYTYTLNGKKVTPEIGYFDHSLKAMISTPRSGDEYFDYEFYRIGEPDESGNIELSPEKGKKGMYTEAKIESDFFEREPKSKDIEKGEGIIAKTKKLLNFQKELKTLSKDMQDLAAEYREAEGSDKDEILRTLKIKTAAKKELEKKIEQLEKYV